MTLALAYANLPENMGSENMALPWKNLMTARVQDREIKKFMDGSLIQAAYGGMVYRNATPPANNIGTTPEKITLYDDVVPAGGPLVNVSFDQATSELVVADGQGGAYAVVFGLDFIGEQGQTYTAQGYIDSGSGPQPAGPPLFIRVSGADPVAETEQVTMFQVNGGWRVSTWINGSAANATFEPFLVTFQMFRISPQMADIPPP